MTFVNYLDPAGASMGYIQSEAWHFSAAKKDSKIQEG